MSNPCIHTYIHTYIYKWNADMEVKRVQRERELIEEITTRYDKYRMECMYVCTHECMYVQYIRTNVCVCVYVYRWVYECVCMYVCTHECMYVQYIRTNVCVCVYVYRWVYECVCMYVCVWGVWGVYMCVCLLSIYYKPCIHSMYVCMY